MTSEAPDRAPGGFGALVVISGPSGVGKGTVVRQLLTDPTMRVSVSATTRTPRPGEQDGVHYHFLDQAAFEEQIAAGAFLEHASYAGNHYGTPAAPVLAAVAEGAVVILEIEVQGALQVRARAPEALLVFLLPPSVDELAARLRGRGTEDDARVALRLRVAEEELAQAASFDVRVVNDDLDRCVEEVRAAIAAHQGAQRGPSPTSTTPGQVPPNAR